MPSRPSATCNLLFALAGLFPVWWVGIGSPGVHLRANVFKHYVLHQELSPDEYIHIYNLEYARGSFGCLTFSALLKDTDPCLVCLSK